MDVLLSWAPKYHVFVRRTLMRGLLTFLILMTPVLILAAANFVLVPLYTMAFPLTLTAIFFFDDIFRWRVVRFERWHVQDGHLIHEGAQGNARMPLTGIDQVTTRFGGRVVVRLSSGQRVVIRYLPFPQQTAEQIMTAVEDARTA